MIAVKSKEEDEKERTATGRILKDSKIIFTTTECVIVRILKNLKMLNA